MAKHSVNQGEIWNDRASWFPGALDDRHRERFFKRLALLPPAMLPVIGQRCLDIGAGTGVFSIYAAQKGAHVTALDVSPVMLERLRALDTTEQIETVQSTWQEIDPKKQGWEKAFDLVFVQMVPGFSNVADLQRMEACSKNWCTYIGWGHKREEPWLEAAFKLHDTPWAVPPGLPQVLDLLAELGRHPKPIWLDEEWVRDQTIQEAITDAISHLALRGIPANEEKLRELALGMARDGRIVSKAQVQIGLIAWQPDKTSTNQGQQ